MSKPSDEFEKWPSPAEYTVALNRAQDLRAQEMLRMGRNLKKYIDTNFSKIFKTISASVRVQLTRKPA